MYRRGDENYRPAARPPLRVQTAPALCDVVDFYRSVLIDHYDAVRVFARQGRVVAEFRGPPPQVPATLEGYELVCLEVGDGLGE